LHHVRQLVRQNSVSYQRAWSIFPSPECDVTADGEGASIESGREMRRAGVMVNAHAREIVTEGGFHSRLHAAVQRLAGAKLTLDGARVGIVGRAALAGLGLQGARRRFRGGGFAFGAHLRSNT